MKTCITCKKTLSLSSFGVDVKARGGRRANCRTCRNSVCRLRRVTRQAGVLNPTTYSAVVDAALPDPAKLPAAYLKRCADYWLDLVGNSDTPVARIA